MNISRHQIMAFAAVGREKSFSKAATALGLSQSAVTQHISALEKEIGATLFVRNRSGAALTQAGRDLYLLADQIRVLEEQFHERANQYADLTAGSLSVCVSTPLPAMAVIAAFKNAYPGVEINLQMAPWREAIALLRKRDVDTAIIMQPDSLDGLYSIEIERRPFVLVLPENHSLASHSEIDLEILKQETLIMLSDASYTRHWVNQISLRNGLSWENTLTVTSYEMMLEAVIQGLGVAIALEGAQSHYQGITSIPLKGFSEAHPYVVASSKDKAALLTVRRFIEIAEGFNSL